MAYDIGPKIKIDGEKEFKSAISGINSDMKVLASEMKKVSAEFGDNKDSIEALTAKNDVLNKQIDTQKGKVEELKKALENAKNQYGETDTKTKNWQISLNNAEADLAKLTNEVDSNNKKMEQGSDAVNDISKEIKDFGDNAEKSEQKTLSLGDVIKANLISSAIIDGVKSLAGSIKDLASGALDSADSIQQMADQSGMSAEKIQEWSYVGDTVGTSIDTITGAQVKLTKSMANAKDGSDKYVAAFKELGISATDSNGNLRDSNTVMLEAFDALGKVKNETERNALGMQLFGKSFTNLNPLIKTGSDEIKNLTKQAKDSGAVMSNETVSGLDNFGDSLGQVKTSLTGIAGSILSDLMPNIQAFITKVQENAPAIEKTVSNIAKSVGELISWLVNNSDIVIPIIAGIGTGFVVWNVASMIQGVITTIQGLSAALGIAKTAQEGVNIAMAANPIGIVVTLVGTIVAALVTFIATNKDARKAILNAWNSIKDGIGSAVKKVKEVFTGLVTSLKKLPGNVYNGIKDTINRVVSWGNSLKAKASAAASGMLNAVTNGVKNLPSNIKTIGSNAVKSLWNGVNGLKSWIAGKIKGFGGSVINSLKNGITGLADIGTNLVKGIWNGINNATDWIIEKIKGFSNSVINAIKGIFGIHSPSTVMRDQVGKFLAQGIGVGFENEMANVAKQMNNSIPTSFKLSSLSSSTSSTGSASKAISSNSGINVIVNIQEFINNTSSDMETLGNELAFATKRKLQGGGVLAFSTI